MSQITWEYAAQQFVATVTPELQSHFTPEQATAYRIFTEQLRVASTHLAQFQAQRRQALGIDPAPDAARTT